MADDRWPPYRYMYEASSELIEAVAPIFAPSARAAAAGVGGARSSRELHTYLQARLQDGGGLQWTHHRCDRRVRQKRASHTHCAVRGDAIVKNATCEDTELALLPASDWWLTGLLLAFPLPMRADSVHELGCLA